VRHTLDQGVFVVDDPYTQVMEDLVHFLGPDLSSLGFEDEPVWVAVRIEAGHGALQRSGLYGLCGIA
jgi:hypothetical protein